MARNDSYIRTGTATVTLNAGSHYLLSPLPQWEQFPAVLRGKIRLSGTKSTNPIAVGDKVEYAVESDPVDLEHPAVITGIVDRKNYLIRKSTNLSKQSHVIAANIDMAYIIVTLYFPEIKLPLLDRILVTCEAYGVPATIVLSKTDLYRDADPDYLAHFHDIYEGAGYRILETSSRTGEGVGEIREEIKGKVCLFSGESGVGKSSLIKALDPTLDPKIGEISLAHLQGKHTTSLYEMYKVSTGGWIIDSPGIRGFGLTGIDREEISLYFPEMKRIGEECRFKPCTHTHEPGCAVKEAARDGRISAERYSSYLGMLEENMKFRQG